jgi:drug/metabolite transporter (DMT)-like permease
VSLSILLLVLLSASLHVLWNALIKQADNKGSFLWLTIVASTAMLAPAFVLLRVLSPGRLDGDVLAWAGLSGLIESGYIILLLGAYERADLSVAYPLSRGVAPLVTLAAAGWLLGDVVGLWHGLAVLAVVAGVAAVSFSAEAAAKGGHRFAGVMFAIAAGVLIAGYHLVDRHVLNRPNGPDPIEYIFLMHLSLTGFVTVWVVLRRRLRAKALAAWRTGRRGIVIVGALGPLAYLLILLAMSRAEGNVTYVAAGRNVGIVVSTAVGALFLRERVRWRRAIGAGLIALGVIALVLLDAGR